MKLDHEEQRKLLLAAINSCNWPGHIVEEVIKLKIAVHAASLENQLMDGTETPED